MEYFLAAIIKFLVDQVGFLFLDRVRQSSQSNPALEKADESSHVTLQSPRTEYLEAMFGDLIEWQQSLQQQGLSRLVIFSLTLLAIGECVFGMLRITLQSLMEEPLPNTFGDSTPDDISDEPDDDHDD